MKKKYLSLLPLLLVASCSNQVAVGNEEFVPYVYESEGHTILRANATSGHVTYLMCSLYGYVDVAGVPEKGKVDEKFYENTITYIAEPGQELPEAKSEVGATFRGWAYYDPNNDNVHPDYYQRVPETNGLALKAIFDGAESGGGQGGGGGGGSTPVVDSYSVTIQVDLSIFEGWEGISNFSVYLWGEQGQEPLGKWEECEGNLIGSGNIKSVTSKTIDYQIVGAIFYFDQAGGDFPGRKQTTDMSIHISSSGTYKIQCTGTQIDWNSSGLMTNFTIGKVS